MYMYVYICVWLLKTYSPLKVRTEEGDSSYLKDLSVLPRFFSPTQSKLFSLAATLSKLLVVNPLYPLHLVPNFFLSFKLSKTKLISNLFYNFD